MIHVKDLNNNLFSVIFLSSLRFSSSSPTATYKLDNISYQFNFNSTPHGQSLSPPRPSNLSPPNYLYGHRDSMYEYGMAESTAFGASTTNPSPSRPKVATG